MKYPRNWEIQKSHSPGKTVRTNHSSLSQGEREKAGKNRHQSLPMGVNPIRHSVYERFSGFWCDMALDRIHFLVI